MLNRATGVLKAELQEHIQHDWIGIDGQRAACLMVCGGPDGNGTVVKAEEVDRVEVICETEIGADPGNGNGQGTGDGKENGGNGEDNFGGKGNTGGNSGD